MSDPDEISAVRRSRRSTAGNRMEAALAEIMQDDLTKDIEDDIDFVNDKEEEDIFESDFESTDEELAQQDESGDKVVQDEEKQARKAARVRLAKATALAHSRQKITFQPHAVVQQMDALGSTSSSSKLKSKRRVSLGFAVDVETGEIIEGTTGKRQSQRKHTVMNTSETVSRLKRSEAKRAAATPKRAKTQLRAFTQDELIANALDNEEGNIVEHRDYLKTEEEKRKRARVVRTTIAGPLIRWVSKAEIVKVPVDPPVSTPPLHVYPYGVGTGAQPAIPKPQASYSLVNTLLPYHPQVPPTQPQIGATLATSEAIPQSQPSSFSHPSSIPAPIPLAPPPPIERSEKVAKIYVVHELGQYEAVPQPVWRDTMEAMFGDHVHWEDLRVFVGKSRPLARPKRFCPITGKLARYMDPRTRVPFADLAAYKTLSKVLAHEYVWSDTLGCYVSHQDAKSACNLQGHP